VKRDAAPQAVATPRCALVPLTTCEEKLGSASILASLPDCMPMISLQRFNENEEGAEKKEHQDSTAMLPEKNQELPMSTFGRLATPFFRALQHGGSTSLLKQNGACLSCNRSLPLAEAL
jgi:hypothetical protein